MAEQINVRGPKFEVYNLTTREYMNDINEIGLSDARGDNNLLCLEGSDVKSTDGKRLHQGDIVRDIAKKEVFMVNKYTNDAGYQCWNVSSDRSYQFLTKILGPDFKIEMLFQENV